MNKLTRVEFVGLGFLSGLLLASGASGTFILGGYMSFGTIQNIRRLNGKRSEKKEQRIEKT